jgi:FtsP/CotA-like multicopper oxidase with cupredoxin domain
MNRLAVLGLVCLLFSACGRAHAATRDQHLSDIFPAVPEIRSVRGVARVTLNVIVDPVTGYPAFEWGTKLGVAPTIRIKPGDTIDMTVHNLMRAFAGRPDNINVHFHGLTVSPRPPGDDSIMTIAAPGQTLHYTVHIPARHLPGLFWYHPHAHGESYYDVTNGMSGAIVVEGMQQRLPALAAMRERIMVLRDVPTGPGFVDDDMPIAGMVQSTRRQLAKSGTGKPCRPEPGLQPTLNRQAPAHIGIRPGERQFFRVVNAAAARYFDLSVDGSQLELVALDGVPIDAAPGNAPTLTVSHVLVPPAGRAEFVVTGARGGSVLRSACVDTGRGGDADPPVVLAQLDDPDPDDADAAPPANAGGAVARNPRDDVRPPAGLPAPAAHRTIRFTEDDRGFYINGASYAMNAPPMVVARSGTVEEWTIENATDEVHAFHIHQVHFLTESIDGGAMAEHVWLDTVNVPPRKRLPDGRYAAGRARLLVDFRDPIVRGTFLFHCHILDHEDQGMMATIKVI